MVRGRNFCPVPRNKNTAQEGHIVIFISMLLSELIVHFVRESSTRKKYVNRNDENQ